MMLRKIIISGILVIVVGAGSTFAQKTVIRDQAAGRLLLGRHKLALQWISWDYFGTATVTGRKGVFFVKGEQKQRGGNDFLRIDGKITRVEKTSFTFVGTIETRVSHINNGQVCTRDGEMTFRITGKRKYWRLMQMDNPCDPVTDYVDIFFH
jgi:hypothetical protein